MTAGYPHRTQWSRTLERSLPAADRGQDHRFGHSAFHSIYAAQETGLAHRPSQVFNGSRYIRLTEGINSGWRGEQRHVAARPAIRDGCWVSNR
jgi:hypothetical protein